jgi:hypothetical protein
VVGCCAIAAGLTIMNSSSTILAFFLEQPWVIPVIGTLVASLAFLVGRRWVGARATPPPAPPPEEPPSNLMTVEILKKPSAPDRRSSPRRKGNRVEVYVTDDSKRPPLLGWVVDRSMGGLCLMLEKPITEGATMTVRPRQAPQTAPWTPIEIRSCRPDGNEWEVHCRFCKTPHWNDLLLFG